MPSANTTRFPGEHLTGDIEFFTAYTLVDVTDSRVTHPSQINSAEYNQAQNLNVLLQSIGLRAQPVVSSVTAFDLEPVAGHNFGTDFTGDHTVWVVKFATEYTGAWTKEGNSMFYLEQDCDQVAISAGLEETAAIAPQLFETADAARKNLYFVRNAYL